MPAGYEELITGFKQQKTQCCLTLTDVSLSTSYLQPTWNAVLLLPEAQFSCAAASRLPLIYKEI